MNFKINKKAFLDALIISNKALSSTIPLTMLLASPLLVVYDFT